jgi:hypothetical protein
MSRYRQRFNIDPAQKMNTLREMLEHLNKYPGDISGFMGGIPESMIYTPSPTGVHRYVPINIVNAAATASSGDMEVASSKKETDIDAVEPVPMKNKRTEPTAFQKPKEGDIPRPKEKVPKLTHWQYMGKNLNK